VSFYVEATIELAGEDGKHLPPGEVELIAGIVIDALVDQPGDLDVAANLGTGELTICGYLPGPTARAAVDQADDVVAALVTGLGGGRTGSPVAFNVRPAEHLLDA
jgi:hypothetical protein